MERLSIKEIITGVYYLISDGSENCSTYGMILKDYLSLHQLPSNSMLIFDGSSSNCYSACNEDFLTYIAQFHAVAYILGEKTIEQTNWMHAHLVRSNNIGTRYFNSYDDAYNWCITQDRA